jgi:hypothetical protein
VSLVGFADCREAHQAPTFHARRGGSGGKVSRRSGPRRRAVVAVGLQHSAKWPARQSRKRYSFGSRWTRSGSHVPARVRASGPLTFRGRGTERWRSLFAHCASRRPGGRRLRPARVCLCLWAVEWSSALPWMVSTAANAGRPPAGRGTLSVVCVIRSPSAKESADHCAASDPFVEEQGSGGAGGGLLHILGGSSRLGANLASVKVAGCGR